MHQHIGEHPSLCLVWRHFSRSPADKIHVGPSWNVSLRMTKIFVLLQKNITQQVCRQCHHYHHFTPRTMVHLLLHFFHRLFIQTSSTPQLWKNRRPALGQDCCHRSNTRTQSILVRSSSEEFPGTSLRSVLFRLSVSLAPSVSSGRARTVVRHLPRDMFT